MRAVGARGSCAARLRRVLAVGARSSCGGAARAASPGSEHLAVAVLCAPAGRTRRALGRALRYDRREGFVRHFRFASIFSIILWQMFNVPL